jgi:hypothetical protein
MSLKGYLKRKKRKWDEKRYEREKSLDLQEKLDRQSLRIDASNARKEWHEIKQSERDRADVDRVMQYKRKKRQENSFFGRASSGSTGLQKGFKTGFDTHHDTLDAMFGKPSKKKSGDYFGLGETGFGAPRRSVSTDPFGMMPKVSGGGSHRKTRHRKHKSNSKKGKRIIINL